MKDSIIRFLRSLPLLVITPFALVAAATAIAVSDLAFFLTALLRAKPAGDTVKPRTRAASLVIPNWNGRDLLEKFLPSWIAAIEHHPGSEIIIVDNGSTDGSAEWIHASYPAVKVLALPKNLGFGGGANAGFAAARNDIVVLLNSDMRVEPDFLAPLLDGFTDENVFAVSCQIFLSDPTKRREETGLTQAWWQDGRLHVTHREDAAVDCVFPCFYGGGGSCAFDRRKFLELGGFDHLYAPFYLEDTDIGYLAWKRGWKVLYQPRSVVFHEHRGTIGKRFSDAYIQSVLQRNFALFVWKNIHSWKKLGSHFFFSLLGAAASAWRGPAPGSFHGFTTARGLLRAFANLPAALRSRRRAQALASINDSEAFLRTRPDIFHDRFSPHASVVDRPRVLFVSPYPVCPPTHGGGVFMYHTLRQLARTCEVHAVIMLDYAHERAAHRELELYCRSMEFVVRRNDRDPHLASITPHAVHEFYTHENDWLLQREVLRHRIDVIQLEYTALGQYARPFQNLVTALFEHDIYFQSIGRALPWMRSLIGRIKARFEYIRAIRFELQLLPRCDHVQVCTRENREYLESFLPSLAGRVSDGMRAGVDTALYGFPGGPRRPHTMLFLGSFRHIPNQVALDWFLREVLPLVRRRLPEARVVVAGSDPPPRHSFHDPEGTIEFLGFVDDIQPLFASCALFVCPIRSGSGIRVKLLEAFASGIPVVSTPLGAEGLARSDGEFCGLAADAQGFADRVVQYLEDPHSATEMAARARREVETNWDMAVVTDRLAAKYISLITEKRQRP